MSGMRGVGTYEALLGVLDEGTSVHDRSKLVRANSPRQSAALVTRANGLFKQEVRASN
jgi:hypothetical protein